MRQGADVARWDTMVGGAMVLFVALAWTCPAAGDPEIAFGREVTNKALFRASRDMELAQALGLNVGRPWVPNTRFGAMDPSPSLSSHDWCLLLLEADGKLPAETNPQAVNDFLVSKGVRPQEVEKIRQKHKASDDELHRAVLNYLRIMSVAEQAGRGSVNVDDRQVQRLIRLAGRRVSVKIGVLEARHLMQTIGDPTEEQLRQHYERYRKISARESPDGVGYLYTHQVVLDVVAARIDDLKPQFQVSDKEREDHWEAHKGEFWVTDEGRKLAGGDEQVHVLNNFRDRVTDVIKAEKIHARAVPALQTLLAELRHPFEGAATDALSYKVAPPEVRSLEYLESVVGRISESTGLKLEVTRTKYCPVTELSLIPGLGQAWAQDFRGRKIIFEHLVRRAKEMSALPPAPGDTFALGHFEPSPKILANKYDGRDRDLFIYRVVDVKISEPASFEAIRGRALIDWRLLRAYEQTLQDAASWVSAARGQGIDESWEALHDIRNAYSESTRPLHPEPFSRRKLAPPPVYEATNSMTFPSQVPGLPWATPEIIDDLFERADTFWSSRKEGSHAVFLLGSPRAKVVGAVEVLSFIPAKTSEKKQRLVRSMVEGSQIRDHARSWFDRAHILERARRKPSD
ncbi:MAG: hypothetical protein V3W34_17605 [Phycisphaerae bacterium]